MMLEPDSIGDQKILADLLRNFDIALTNMPALPISFKGLVEFLIAEGISADAINAFVRHVGGNANLFVPVAGNRITAHIWPDRTQDPERCVANEVYWSKHTPILSRESKVVSLGSSFADEIAKWLHSHGYNCAVNGPDVLAGRAAHHSSARWGTFSNAVGFCQIVNWAFGLDDPPLVVYRKGEQIRDPFREGVVYTEGELPQLERLWQEHTARARAALQEADVIVLVLDTTEVFRYLPTGHYLHHIPRSINPALWEPQLLSLDDIVDMLKAAIEQLRGFNPNVKFIVGVDATPLVRTFRRDLHVAAATAQSKAVLRIALEQLCNSVPEVHYMASFETMMYPGDLAAWTADERNVSDAGIDKIMRLFQQQFCPVADGLLATRSLVPAKVSNTNPYFETDHRIIREAIRQCVADGLVSAAEAIDMLNYCTPALYNDEFHRLGYGLLRRQSFRSRFRFNRLCREMYREAFATTFAKTPQSEEIYKGLHEQGYHVIAATPQSRQFAADMLKTIATLPAQRTVDQKVGIFADLAAEDVAGGFRFFIDENTLPALRAVKLLEDLGVLRAIGDDIGHPILRFVNAWYSVRPSQFGPKDEAKAAQLFHSDNDTPTGWVKVFIYLNDVTEENGPHVFVPGSHRERPADMKRDGRFSDEQVERHFGAGRKLTGPAGTVIVENTQGLHKALTVQSGTRAIFQLECVNCLFGAATDRHTDAERMLAELARYDDRFLQRYSRDYQRQQLSGARSAPH